VAEPEYHRWWPGFKVRAILFVVGCALVAVAWLLEQAGYDDLLAGAVGFTGILLAGLQFTFSDPGID
jgi:hypothetical protein